MEPARISRRDLITAGAVAGVVALAPRVARAQGPPKPAEPATVITTPPRDWGPGAAPNVYGADPDILTIDPSFNSLRQGNTPILRLWTGTLIADGYAGKRLNSPNDVVPHPDGSYWFTDPPYGGQFYEGTVDAPGGPSNRAGRFKQRLGQPLGIGDYKRELPHGVYRVDPVGKVDVVVTEGQLSSPNGLCFSPDYKKLYVISTGRGPGDTGPGGNRDMHVFDVGSDNKLSNQKLFSDFMIDGVKCGPDGVRADVDGNLWVSSNGGRALGYSGVTVWNAEGKLIGRIRLPETCGNICFGGPKRNRLFMAASQSLYAVYVATQGAAPG